MYVYYPYSHYPYVYPRPFFWYPYPAYPYWNPYWPVGYRSNEEHDMHGNDSHGGKDYGPYPFVINIEEATNNNQTFRTALWTGEHLQVTLMSINPGEDIGLENHPDLDQFLRIESGQGFVQMGKEKNKLDFQRHVADDDAILIPANTWHNVTNTGKMPLKLYSIYAPPQHPFGTVHVTKADAVAAEAAEAR